MKQLLKKAGLLIMALTLFLVSLPQVQAEDLTFAELLGRSYEAYTGLKSFHTQGTFTAAVDRQSQHMDLGTLTVDGYVDVENLNLDLKLGIDSLFVPQFRNLRYGVKDNQAFYEMDDRFAQVDDVSEQKANFRENVTEESAKWPAKDDVVKALSDHEDLLKQLFNLTETDSEYVISLREDIDAQKLFDDNKAALDQFKQSIYDQMEARGETVSPSYKAQIDRFYSAETLTKFLASKPVFEVHLAKDTYLVTAYKVEVTLRFTDFLEANEVEQLGLYTFYYKADVTLDGYNESHDIEVPTPKPMNTNSVNSSDVPRTSESESTESSASE